MSIFFFGFVCINLFETSKLKASYIWAVLLHGTAISGSINRGLLGWIGEFDFMIGIVLD